MSPQAWGYQWPNWCINFPPICFSSLIYAYVLRILPYTILHKLRSKRWVSSDHAGMNKVSCEVSIFYLNSDWINPPYGMKRKFRELYYCSYSTLDCCPYGRFSRKINFSLWRHRKKRIGQKPTKFLRRLLKPLSRAKKSRKTLFDGKSKGPLLARAVLNNEVCLSEAMFSENMLENLRENLVRILQN